MNIVSDSSVSSPIIYLRGIDSAEIESILQFIYLGEATFYQDRMNEFLDVARSLEVNEICKDLKFWLKTTEGGLNFTNEMPLNKIFKNLKILVKK